MVKYLTDGPGSGNDYEIVNPPNPAAPTTPDHEIIFGKGTTSIDANKTTNGIYNIPANVIKTLSRVSTNVANIKKIMDTSYYKQNYSIDRWREFVKNYVDNLMNVNAIISGGTGETELKRELLDGQQKLEAKAIAGTILSAGSEYAPGTRLLPEDNMDDFFKACKTVMLQVYKKENYMV